MKTFTALLVGGFFAVAAGAHDRPINPATDADQGTPATSAAEAEGHVRASNGVKPIGGTDERRKAVANATREADQGTPETRNQEASGRISASGLEPSTIDRQGRRSALKAATAGSTK